MAIILPFHGIRYDLNRAGAMEDLVAPPYDVVTREQRDRLVAQNPHNIFALELPDDNGGGYRHAADTFNSWLDEGIIKREDEPAIYPYEIEFKVDGKVFLRHGIIALVRIEDWESHIIRPHEKTFNSVTEDRYRLLKATEAQFSQIFAIYRHNESVLRLVLQGKSMAGPLFEVNDQSGNTHRLWRLAEKELIRGLHNAFLGQALYIADGHHRYTTALKYRNDMRATFGMDPSMPYNYIMTYLVDAEDPGLMVLPTHRIVTMEEGWASFEALARIFEKEDIVLPEGTGPEGVASALSNALSVYPERRGIGVVRGSKKDSAQVWWPKQDLGGTSALAGLDVFILEEVVLKALSCKAISYSSDAVSAIQGLSEGQVLFYLRAAPVGQILDIADAGLTMPHKSTFFYPKILTGPVLNSVSTKDTLNPL